MAISTRSYAGGLTAATVVLASPTILSGLTVNATNIAGASTITIFDNAAAATGTILFQVTIPTQAAVNTQTFNLPTSVRAVNGLTVVVATTAVGDITFWVG